MIGAQVLVREYNNYPTEFKAKLRTLQPDEIIKVKLNPSLWGMVKETQFPSIDASNPIPGRINVVTERVATRWLPNPWSVNTGNGIIQCGFLQGYNTVDNTPIWRDRFFINGEMIFDGSNPTDVEDFYALQCHPECRRDGVNNKPWKFYVENPEENADNSIAKIEWRANIQNKVLALTDDQLRRLAQSTLYNRNLLNKPTHATPKAMRGYIANLLSTDSGFSMVNNLLNRLAETYEIELIEKALNTGKLICSDFNLKRSDNFTLGSFTEPLVGSNTSKAIQIYDLYKTNPNWKNDITQWLIDDERKSPSGGKRASKLENLSE
jgi:hypothetical protein